MSWKASRLVKRLGLAVPIVQGPFGGGLSSPVLTAIVSNCGGLGSFGAHHLKPEQIGSVAQEIRALTDGPFALNLWVSNQDPGGDQIDQTALAMLEPYCQELGLALPSPLPRYGEVFEEQVPALLEASPAVFSFVSGIPSRAIQEECLMGSISPIPRVVDQVTVPVIAAGGIADGRGILAALALGADAVQIGTAFLACRESSAPQIHREALLSESAAQTSLTRAFTGRLARGIANELSFQAPVSAYPAQSWLTGTLRKAAIQQGRTDLMALWAGQSAPLIRHQSAAELMQSLREEVETLRAAI